MPRHCITAACSTVSGEGYSLHEFLHDNGHRAIWTHTVKLQRVRWNGPTAGCVLCSKHFEPHSFIIEGVWHCDAVGILAKKRLKPNAMPTIFPKPDDGNSQQTTPSQRPAS